ncbi:MAG: carboxypeptidase regulatory-like domain-containing protein, partial [Candidatus Contendobacter sp.]|nr:carboxypeptidase regulatory-like domain-containing protein [Candidatus Contendobacter sp.]
AYTVRETDPADYVSTTPNDVAIAVPPGGGASANFGDRQIGSVAGREFNDLNGNGIQDAGEAGISGVRIELVDTLGTVVQSVITAGDGSYFFSSVSPGAYTVRKTDPAGYISTTPSEIAITVPPGGAASANFGDRQQGGTISGVVFNDLNGNGIQETGEPGIGGVTLTLKDNQGVTVATTTTDGDGRYTFTGVTAGNYQIVETDPAGYTSTTVNAVPVTVTDGRTATIHFGDQISGSNLRADVLLFPYFAVSDTVTSVVSVINRADQNGATVPRPQTLHYRIYSKNGATADNLTTPCEEFDVRRVTSPNDVVTFDLTGHYGDRLGVLAEPVDRQAKANYAAQNQSFAFMKGLQPARGFLVVDNNEAPNTPFEPSLAGDLMVIDFAGGAAWGYAAYNAAPDDTSAPMAYNFEDAAERVGEVLAGNRAITPTDLNGGASPSAPVNLLPFASVATSGGMQTRFLVTPIGHSVTFPTGTVSNPWVASQTQLRNDLTTQVRLQAAFATGDANDVMFDRDENPVSGQAPQNVTCVGAVNVDTLLSAGALREIGEYGGWSGVEIRSPGALASLSTTNPPTATRTNNTNQATVIKLEFGPDGRFLGESFKSSFNNALWLRRGIRESVFGTAGGAPGIVAPRLRIRSAADGFGYPVDVANDFVRDSLGVSPY